MTAVVGVFPGREETETAIDALVDRGFSVEDIGVVWREKSVPKREEVEVFVYVDHFEDPAIEARKGAIGGAVGGGTIGVGSAVLATAGGVVLATPVGSLLAVGTTAAAALAGATGTIGGSITGGLIGALLGASDHDAAKVKQTDMQYRDTIERDGFVVTIEVREDLVDKTVDAMSSVGASDVSVLRGLSEHPRTVTFRSRESSEDADTLPSDPT